MGKCFYFINLLFRFYLAAKVGNKTVVVSFSPTYNFNKWANSYFDVIVILLS